MKSAKQDHWLAPLALFAVACSSAPGGTLGPEGGVLRFDAAMLGPPDTGAAEVDASVAGDGGALPADAFVPPDAGVMIRDHYPDVPIVHVGHADFAPLRLVAFNIAQNRSLEEVFIVLRNEGSITYCSTTFDVDYLDAGGNRLRRVLGTTRDTSLNAYGYASDCIPPGTEALGYGNASYLADLDRVARIEYFFSGSAPADLSSFATVRELGASVVDPYGGSTYRAVQGTLLISGGSVRNLSIWAFPNGADGLPFAQLIDADLATRSAGSQYAYTTTSTETPFTTFRMAVSFRNTTTGIVADSPGARAALEAQRRYEEVARAVEANRLPVLR
ncbi:MAG: hypothetical protein K8H88_08095 [Sandaracinaceae bacterium]|nr:hypothetical protein [Sandaracinaceae bacterium]